MREGISLIAPIRSNAFKCVLFANDLNAYILGARMACLEKPFVGGLALQFARVRDFGQTRFRMLAKISRKPKFQRMNAREISAIRKRDAAGIVRVIQFS